nr:cell division protein FtsQ [Prevotella sp.]
MKFNWKKSIIVVLDVAIAIYLVFAVTSFNKPDDKNKLCTKVNINISDEVTDGFLSAGEIKNILVRKKIYPLNRQMQEINIRTIEDLLRNSAFVKSAQCYKTEDGHVCINIKQRMPIIRIKDIHGEDYYLDDQGGIMPNTKYVSNLIIATGYIPQWYARKVLKNIASFINHNDFWKNQIVQLNVLSDLSIEIVPRVGDHIVYLGRPTYIPEKLSRLEKFYKYGLNEVGWNKYSYISLEFNNQIICKKKQNI